MKQKAQFCQMQFDAQDAHYRQHYSSAEYLVIEVAGVPAGRLYADRWPKELRVMDIALLPSHRGLGIGTHLLRQLIDEAKLSAKLLSIHAQRLNPALNLYQRLGLPAGPRQGGLSLLLEWRPEAVFRLGESRLKGRSLRLVSHKADQVYPRGIR